MDRNRVSLETNLCIVCSEVFDTGALLLQMRGKKPKLERTMCTGFGMCEEHAKLRDDGYIACIGIDPTKSKIKENGLVDPRTVQRTGKVAHVRKHLFENVFDRPAVGPDGKMLSVVFMEPVCMDMLEKLHKSISTWAANGEANGGANGK